MKCADCDHKYCEFCNAGDKYQKKAKSNAVTHFDRIKAMSVEEMAEFLTHISTDCDKICVFVDENGDCIGCGRQCAIGIKEWLESEV